MLSQNKWFFIFSGSFLGLFWFFSYFNFVVNYTHSLPQKIFIVKVGDKVLNRGDYVVFKSLGLPNTVNGVRVIKKVVGINGDEITVKDNSVYINNKYLTKIYSTSAVWGKIHPINNTKIPAGCFFLMGTAKTSFDSRYMEFGLICKKQIIGKAYPYF